jgi:uncharacterized membrane protein YfcA
MAEQPKKKEQKSPNKFLRFTTIGLQIGLTIWLGNEFGNWLDRKYNKEYFEPILTLFSIFISLYLVISQVITLSKDDD